VYKGSFWKIIIIIEVQKSPYFEEKSLTYLVNEFLSRQIKAGFAG
jgi:hypothetical protein